MFCLFVYAEAIPSSYTSLEIDLEFLKEQASRRRLACWFHRFTYTIGFVNARAGIPTTQHQSNYYRMLQVT